MVLRAEDGAGGPRVPGIGAELPEGERLVWSGKPDLKGLAWRVFHLRTIYLWLGILAGWRGLVWAVGESGGIPLIADLAWIGVVALAATGLVFGFAWLTRRNTVYALTDQRVLMKIGVALDGVLNIPLHQIRSASWKEHADGTGDIALEVDEARTVGYALLWPHARPWRIRRPQPSLRAVPDARTVADLYRRAAEAADPGRIDAGASDAGRERPSSSGRAERRDGRSPVPVGSAAG